MKCAFSLKCTQPAWPGGRFCQAHRDDHIRRTAESRLRRIEAKPDGECQIPHCAHRGWRGLRLCKKHVLAARQAGARQRLKTGAAALPTPRPSRGRASYDSIDAFIRDMTRRLEMGKLFQERRHRR